MLTHFSAAAVSQARWSQLDPQSISVGSADARYSPADSGWEDDRYDWVLACADRLLELRPGEDRNFIASVAADMWMDVGSHDPRLAAEMEHESWPWED